MTDLHHEPAIPDERLLAQLDDAMTRYQTTTGFSCSGSLDIGFTKYGDFTSAKKPVKCPRPILFWRTAKGCKSTTIDSLWTTPRDYENSLEELVEDCSPATFGYEGESVLDEKIRKAGAMDAKGFSTNFNPGDFGIVDTIARELQPGIARAGNQEAVPRWGIVAELYKLNVYSGPLGMFKPHIDTPRGRTHFGSLVVALPTDYKGSSVASQGGQLVVTHEGKKRLYLDQTQWHHPGEIRWVAFYSDCEHEVLPVTAGHRVTLTYQLYVSEYLGGLLQPQVKTPGSACYPMYRSAKDMLASPEFLKKGGILGFWCAYQYPERMEGTDSYQRYPLTLKGADTILFAIFRALGLTVHIKPYEPGSIAGGVGAGEFVDAGIRFQRLLSTEEQEAKAGAAAQIQFQLFNGGHYVGNEIFRHAKWFNKPPTMMNPTGAECLDGPKPTTWIGNETEIDWDYAFRVLLVVVPAFPDRRV
ncbi:hypothetical protein B0T10DRAFT_609316 [Thelonectria olida]|uniref:Fe2OG dioxygenase domain-containing protein n=1 Tax=Thelonectria olida TaxID=1576542 RepID=A0A9P8VW53_9HYPO|nr:hypothetical protein B0T10DRAFT_609316 [Thelonectria olida]